jgi:hypothetical protein
LAKSEAEMEEIKLEKLIRGEYPTKFSAEDWKSTQASLKTYTSDLTPAVDFVLIFTDENDLMEQRSHTLISMIKKVCESIDVPYVVLLNKVDMHPIITDYPELINNIPFCKPLETLGIDKSLIFPWTNNNNGAFDKLGADLIKAVLMRILIQVVRPKLRLTDATFNLSFA